MTRKNRARHRIGGVHHVRLGHRKCRDVVGDRIEVLGIAGALRRAGCGAPFVMSDGASDDMPSHSRPSPTDHQYARSMKARLRVTIRRAPDVGKRVDRA